MHKNLIMTETEWAGLNHKLQDPFFKKIHANNERACDIMIAQSRDDFWNLSGDLNNADEERDNPYFWRIPKQRLIRFAVSWRLTGREDCLAEALRTVDVIIDPKYWITEPLWSGLKHADLRTADWWTSATFALESLAPVLSKKQESELVRCLVDWGLPAYLKGIEEGDWWRYSEFNWGPALHGSAGVAALAMQDIAPDLASEVLSAAKKGLQNTINYFPAGGGSTEGLMYQCTTLTHLTEFVSALYRLEGDDLGLKTQPRFRDGLDSRLWMLGGDQKPINFSNCYEYGGEWRFPGAYWWAQQCGRPDWAGFEDAFPRPWEDTNGIAFEVEAFWHRAVDQPATPWQQPVGLWHGRELDWLSWKRDKTWLSFRSGFNGGNHNNLDLGQIIYGVGTSRILGDPGYMASATAQHNCITFKRRDQTVDATAEILKAEEIPFGTHWLLHVWCDLKSAYPHTLERHHRHVIAISDSTLIILDHAMGKGGQRINAHGYLQCMSAPKLEESKLSLETEQGDLAVRSHNSAEITIAEPYDHDDRTIYPLSYNAPIDSPEARFIISVSSLDSLAIIDTGHAIEISAPTGTITLDLPSGIINTHT
ncbi:MAG: hypothetical protein MK080_02375 [Opitutales bacterium]|nr:hypothetical protein [Opitutales bacterium]NRA26490.1 hypothetical protein [Opitutales bacterium]